MNDYIFIVVTKTHNGHLSTVKATYDNTNLKLIDIQFDGSFFKNELRNRVNYIINNPRNIAKDLLKNLFWRVFNGTR